MSLVHGMAGRHVARVWPALTVAALAPVMEGFPHLGAVQAVEWHSARPFASSAIVRCEAVRVFVKRHDRRVRSVEDLLEEHAFMAHLRAHGTPVPLVHANARGATAVDAANAVWEVHALGLGDDRYRDALSWTPVRGPEDARAAGLALARLHGAAEGFAAPPRRTRLLVASDALARAVDPLEALAAQVAADDGLCGALAGRPWRDDARRVLLPWYAALGAYSETPLWSHGDFHASNLLWQRGAVSAVLDFGLCNRASAAWDLATAIERNAIAWLDLSVGCTDIGHADLACAMLEGYAEYRPVPDSLSAVLPVVHVEFALSELAYFHAVTRSRSDAEAAYTDFLLGHPTWFATPDGRVFLDRVAACC